MRRLSLASFAASVVLAGSLLAASAPPATAGTLDQSQTDISLSGYNIGSNQWVAQTFTAGLSGPLDQVDLYMYTTICTPPADLTVEIRNVSSGVPTGTALATATVDKASVPISPADWVPALFPTPTSVSAGDSYAIVASTTANCPGFDFGPYVWRFVGGILTVTGTY